MGNCSALSSSRILLVINTEPPALAFKFHKSSGSSLVNRAKDRTADYLACLYLISVSAGP